MRPRPEKTTTSSPSLHLVTPDLHGEGCAFSSLLKKQKKECFVVRDS